MTGHELLAAGVVIAAAVWAVRAYFWPFAPCRACGGRKTNPGSTRKRFGLCKKCAGTGSRQVLGSKTVHRTVQALRLRNRERDKP
jgi:hypothetical protein